MSHRHGWLGSRDGMRLFWQSWLPEDRPRGVVVLVHGVAEHGGRYAHVAERLTAAGYAVHALDHRGHGRSDGARAMIDRLDRLVDDLRLFVARVREEHDGRRPFLVGHSLGGAVSLAYALRHPETVEGLVLSGPAVATEAVPAAQRLLTRLLSVVAPRLPVFKIDDELISRDAAVVRAYQDDPLNHCGKLPARTLSEIVLSMQRLPAEVSRLSAPLLLLHGGEDKLCTPQGSRMIDRGASSRDKTLIVYEGLYHEVFNEPERDRVIDDLVTWLGERSHADRLEEVTAR
jgi:acylglycerol lipase